jgi:hypothetical protein
MAEARGVRRRVTVAARTDGEWNFTSTSRRIERWISASGRITASKQTINGPLQLAVRLPHAGDTASLRRLTTTLQTTPGIASVAAPRLNRTRDRAAITVYPTTSPQSEQTTSLAKHLRDDILPPLAKATRTTIYVGGATATQIDFAHVLAGKLPLFIGVVVLLSALPALEEGA